MDRNEMNCSDARSHLNGFSAVPNSTDPSELIHDNNSDVSKDAIPTDSDFHSEIPTLQHLFKQTYQKRLTALDNCDEDLSKKQEEKICILQTYVQQLEEQNDVLVSTMIELEKEAYERVKQMESRLKSSAKSTMEAVINVHDFEQDMRKLVSERLQFESMLDNMQHYFSSLKVENGFLRDQNFNLNHDVQALLHIIHHARSTGNWEMDCVTFCELTPEQVFGPVQSLSQLYAADSPNSSSHFSKVTEKEQKMVLNLSSQDISHSSMSSPSADTPLGLTQVTEEQLGNIHILREAHQELLKRDKTIAILEVHLADTKHKLSVKEAECECHIWKIETLTHQNHKQDDAVLSSGISLGNLNACDITLPKCISLPDIGNIYSYNNIIRKAHSCRTIIEDSYRFNLQFPIKTSICRATPSQIKGDKPANKPTRNSFSKPEHLFGFRRAQSEPHLYMFGDNVYVYRPCEQIKRASNFALNGDFQLSFPPCQSIDLKFPTDNTNLKTCDWDFVHNPHNYSVPVSSSQSGHKIDESSTSCTTSESEDISETKEIPCNNIYSPNINNSFLSAVSENSSNYLLKKESNLLEHSSHSTCNGTKDLSVDPTSNHDIKPKDKKIEMCSIGLQVDLRKVAPIADINKTVSAEMDIDEINNRMQIIKENLLKAEDKAAAKEILIEQLQGHISSAFKEVELKDEVLHIIEKKLNVTRSECSSWKEKLASLETEKKELLNDLKNAKLMKDNFEINIDGKKKEIEELNNEQKVLQKQKRALMTQLDAQGDKLQDAQAELEIMKLKAQSNAVQVEQQNQIIKSLQEALVQSKRAFDAAHQNKPLLPENVNLQPKDRQFSRSSVVDI